MMKVQKSMFEIEKVRRVAVFIGMFGSGKTEIALNFALKLKSKYEEVALEDIDVISPYFRTRDLKAEFEKMGIDVITPEEKLIHADLPIISPKVKGFINKENYRVVIDCGGNDDGAVVLSSLYSTLRNEDHDIFFVINPYRPFTDTVNKTVEHIKRLEKTSRLKISYLVNNSNIGNLTEERNILYGEDFAEKIGESVGIPVAMTVIKEDIKCGNTRFPRFEIKKFLKTPWEV
ncbi:MAG: hypothetical protein PWQ77_1239 [Kosmotogales bacterium]|nr:hypothetical protein [Kosmotogales bacterium]